MAAAGAGLIDAWLPAEEILEKSWPVRPRAPRGIAERTVSAWQALSPDPYGTTYGFFDGHGWNIAFDHARNRLNGIYDFADSGFGALHQEFIYSSFISPDLTERIAAEYEALTGRTLDRQRIALLTGTHQPASDAEGSHRSTPGHATWRTCSRSYGRRTPTTHRRALRLFGGHSSR